MNSVVGRSVGAGDCQEKGSTLERAMRLISVGWKDRDSQDVNPGLETGHVAAYAEKLMSGRGGGMDHEMRDAWWAIRVGGDAKAGSECARKVGGALGPVGHGARCVLPCRREGKGEAGGSLTCRELAQGVR